MSSRESRNIPDEELCLRIALYNGSERSHAPKRSGGWSQPQIDLRNPRNLPLVFVVRDLMACREVVLI
jgi:hypothetical protein